MQVTKEQKEAANQTDLVDYLTSKGYQLEKKGSSYKIKVKQKFSGDLSSLSIFENRRGWKRWSSGEHGGDAISFLQTVMGMNFQDAVLELTDGSAAAYIPPSPKQETPKIPEVKELVLPKRCEGKFSRAFAYLNKSRYIDSNIISQMMTDKKIYQDERNNIVFVGYNEKNEAAFACVRGTNNQVQYRGDCSGSDKHFSFSMEGTSKGKLYVFEAPIDLLSHATMANYVTKNSESWKMHSRICLAGTSDVALEHYLKSHPEVKEIHFVLDNDKAGREAAAKYVPKYEAMGFKVVDHVLKTKDMNEELIAYITKPPPEKKKTSPLKR